MSYQNWKLVRDKLIKAGELDMYGNPVDKERYGQFTSVDLDGNIWLILSDYMEKVDELSKLVSNT